VGEEMSVDISRALKTIGVQGFGHVYYPWLAEQAQTRELIVEIGSWLGGSARAMADNTAGTLFCVDPWTGPEKSEGVVPGGDPKLWEERGHDPEWVWKAFQENMEGLDNVIPMRMTSLEGARWLRNLRFDMIFLDANHSYENAKADLLAWRPLLAPGGLLSGHDWGWQSGSKTLTDAVMETGGGHRIGVDSLWIGD